MADTTDITGPDHVIDENAKAALSKKRGQAAAYIQDPSERQRFIAAQGESERNQNLYKEYEHLDREAEDTLATQGENKAVEGAKYAKGTPGVSVGRGSFMPMYKAGSKHVPKTGVAKLHKGEVRVSKDAVKKAADKPGTPGSDAANVPSSMLDRIKAEVSRRAQHAENIPSDVGRAAMGALGGNPEEMQTGVDSAAQDTEQAVMPQYKDGVSEVPKTGPAVVDEGEAIIPKDEVDEAKHKGKVPPTLKKAVKNEKQRGKVRDDMSLLVPDDGDSPEHEAAESPEFEAGEQEGKEEAAKHPKHITVSKAENGGFVAHHKHSGKMYHLKNEDELLQHMHEHMNG